MKEFFVTPSGTVIVCSKIAMIYRDHATIFDKMPENINAVKIFFVTAVLENGHTVALSNGDMTMKEADAMVLKLTDDIFETELVGYPTHSGKAPGGPLPEEITLPPEVVRQLERTVET